MNSRVTVFHNLTDEQADLYSLILSSAGILFSSDNTEAGWTISVEQYDRQKGLDLINEYLQDNQTIRPEKYTYPYTASYSGLWVSFLLLLSYAALGSDRETIEAFGASAERILSGEPHRTVTALMIHLDSVHLLGNLLGILIFGTAVCSIAGAGAGWLVILVTGIAGNLAGALLYGSGHLSAGASTSVFGALGIITAHQFYKRLRLGYRSVGLWVPVASGLALLGICGSAQGSDLAAHFFGYTAGIIFGALHGFLYGRPFEKNLQVFSVAASVGIVITAWFKAL